MIPEETYNKMYARWVEATGERHIYAEKRRIWNRLLDYDKYVGVFKGKKVLEIGCNAGAHACLICQHADSYIGLEPGAEYSKQNKITSECLDHPDSVFLEGTISDLIKCETAGYDAFAANYVMYHIPDNELALLEKHVFPKVDTVLIQNRSQKRPTPHNSFKFWKTRNLVKWLEKQGLKCAVYDSTETRNYKGKQVAKWQTIVATR